MRLDVAFLPSLVRRPERTVCVVIDVLRATSTLVTLFDQGIEEVIAVAEIDRAFALRDEAKAFGENPPLLCGEVGGLPPPGFDYGNSPVEFSTLDLRGKRAILFTSNGTKALVQVARAPMVLAGSMLNASAIVEKARLFATSKELALTFVCSGTDLGTSFSLEDTYCAGALVATYIEDLDANTTLSDGAQAALRLYHSFLGNAHAAFQTAEHGRSLAKIGLQADADFCASRDRSVHCPSAERLGDTVIITSAEWRPRGKGGRIA